MTVSLTRNGNPIGEGFVSISDLVPNPEAAIFREIQSGGNPDIQLLINNSAKVNFQQDCDGWTPLHCAVFQGREEVVQRLYEHGVNLDTQTKKEEFTPIHLAVFLHGKDIGFDMVDCTQEGFDYMLCPGIHFGQARDLSRVLQRLITLGANLDIKDNKERTPLQLAQELNHEKLVSSLNDSLTR